MSLWILSKHSDQEYENRRLLAEFAGRGIVASLKQPSKFDLLLGSPDLLYDGVAVRPPRALLVRTGSGTDGVAGLLLRDLEQRGIPVINSPAGTELARDKAASGHRLACQGVLTPRTMLVRFPVHAALVEREIGFPAVIKVQSGSYGKGVHLCRSRNEFDSLIDLLEALDRDRPLLIQEFIAGSFGTDLRVWVIDDKVVGAMQRTAPEGGFRANISIGGTGVNHPLNDLICDVALRAARAIGLEIAGVDLLFIGTGYSVCEVNSSPGFAGFESFCQIDVAKLIVDHVVQRVPALPLMDVVPGYHLSMA